MTDLVPTDQIEQIVGARRHRTKHIGRHDTTLQTFYILHSHACKDSGIDLRDCLYSVALDRGAIASTLPTDVPIPIVLEAAYIVPDPDRVVLIHATPGLTPVELQNLAPGCISPHRTDDRRRLLTLLNAHLNQETTMRALDDEEIRLWDHQPADRYIVIIAYPWVNENGSGVDHHSDLIELSFGHAILAGVATAESDDFNIGVIRDGRLVAVLWIDQVTEDAPYRLGVISREIGLTA